AIALRRRNGCRLGGNATVLLRHLQCPSIVRLEHLEQCGCGYAADGKKFGAPSRNARRLIADAHTGQTSSKVLAGNRMLSFVPLVPSSRSWRCVALLYKSHRPAFYSRTPSAARQPGPDALRSSAEQTAHRRGPLSQFARALFRVHAGFEAALQAPMIQKSVR